MESPMNELELENFIKYRNKALLSLDIGWARENDPRLKDRSDEFVLIVLHKARANSTGLPRGVRQRSKGWLRRNGYSENIG